MPLMHVYGRGGDIVMSMAAAGLILEKTGTKPDLCVHQDYFEVGSTLKHIGMPIGEVLISSIKPAPCDNIIFGSSIAQMSSSLLSSLSAHDEHYNCCLGDIPLMANIPGMMCYLTGFSKSLDSEVFPKPSKEYCHDCSAENVVYHFGGSRNSKKIMLLKCPFPNMHSTVVGLQSDPIPDWADADERGRSLTEVASLLSLSHACVGSDSLITNLASLLLVPTVALHDCSDSIKLSDRAIYGTHARSILIEKGGMPLVEVINYIVEVIINAKDFI